MKPALRQPETPLPTPQARRILDGVQAALFDLDNTLIETRIDFPLMKREMLALAERYGVDAETLRERDILGAVEAACATLRQSRRAEEADCLRREAFDLLAAIEVAHCAAPTELPGAAELLRFLRSRAIPVAVVTRNCRAVSERLLAVGRLHCDALLAREDVARAKPHPEHLRAALAALFPAPAIAPPPAACLMVGDHWMDVAAGRAAGMRTVGLRRNRPADLFAPAMPDLLLDDISDLRALWQP